MTTEPAAVPAVAYSEASPAPIRSPRLGFVALVLGVGVFVLSLAASVAMGVAAAPYAVRTGGYIGVYLNASSGDPHETLLALLAIAHIGIGTVIGVWAIVQGIIAIATRRGRGFGIVAVVAAFLAPGLSLVTYLGIALSLAS
jgi:hypothetical protein